MKKRILFIILFIIIMPFIVKAETCEDDKITIESVAVGKQSTTVEEISKPEVNGRNIKLDLQMAEEGDYIEYKLIIKNGSSADYEIEKGSLIQTSEYLNYEFDTEDDTNIVKAGETKGVVLRVEYKTAIPEDKFVDGVYKDDNDFALNLSYENVEAAAEEKNPLTNASSYIIIAFVIFVISIISFVVLRKKKYAKLVALLIGSLALIPMYAYAICKCEIKVESIVRIINQHTFCVYEETPSGGKINYYLFRENDTWGSYMDRNKNMYDKFGLTEGVRYTRGMCETNVVLFGTIDELKEINGIDAYYEEKTETVYPETKIENFTKGCYKTGTAGPCS